MDMTKKANNEMYHMNGTKFKKVKQRCASHC